MATIAPVQAALAFADILDIVNRAYANVVNLIQTNVVMDGDEMIKQLADTAATQSSTAIKEVPIDNSFVN